MYRVPMLPTPSLPRSVQHRWTLRQATQRPPLVFIVGANPAESALIHEWAPVLCFAKLTERCESTVSKTKELKTRVLR